MKEKYITNFRTSSQWLLSFMLLLFVGLNQSFGQTNDCVGSPTLTVGTTCVTTNYNVAQTFTNSGVGITCVGTSWRDGWYNFTTDATTSLITIQGTSNRNLGLALYSGACGTLTQVACSIPGAANANLTAISVSPSTTYQLRLMRTNNPGGNDMTGTVCAFKVDPFVPTTGNNSYSMCSGNIYDNGGSAGNYATSADGYSVINPSTPGNLVRVSGSITAEAGYDYLTIYDGVGTGGTILWGGAAHGTGTACTAFAVPNITSTTGSLTVRFRSDTSTNCAGFNLSVSCIAPTPPTISSLGAASGCVGSSLVINGTNLSGATAVTIGGTAAVITANTATTVTVTVGAGTTGTVQVTTSGGSATSAATFTVNPNPAAIGGGALSVCVGATTPAFTDATGGGTWSITAGTGTASITAGGVVTGLTAGTVTVVYTVGTCSATKALTVNPNPVAIAGGALSVCVGATTPAFTDATGGGTWSITAGTGTASITAGGVVTGLTAGTVTVVYTLGTTCNVTKSLTINPAPAAIGGGAATVCTGATTPAFTNATGGGTWSITNGTGSATVDATTGIVTGVTVGTGTVVYTVGTCSVSTPITVITTPTISTNPASVSIAPGANTSFTVVATNTPTSYTWEVSTNGGVSWTTVTNGGVYSTATTATLNITGATLAMNGYLYHASATNACGTSTFSTNATLTVGITYCAPTYTSGPGTIDGITNVTLLTLNNTTGANNVSPYYTFYNSVVIPNLIQGTSPTISIRYGSDGNQWGAVWIDFNQNGTFEAAEGFVTTVNAGANGTSVLTIPVPGGAVLGNTRMRVRGGNDSILTTAQACGASSSGFGETEDYIVNIIAPVACATPTAQPTALTLTPTGTTIAGSFTAASPLVDNYLVVISTSATAPSPGPVNGVTYVVGGALGGGTVVDIDNNTTFNATGLSVGTTYYIYVYAYNSVCTGGPVYLTTSPLTGNATTLPTNYCTPTTSTTSNGLYISQVSIIGTLNDPGANNSTFAAPMGYQDFTGLAGRAIQADGEGVNIVATSDGVTLVRGAWKAWVDWNKDGDFIDGGELVYDIFGFVGKNVTFGFVIPAGTAPGNYRIRIRVNNGVDMFGENYGFDFNSCQNFGTSGGNDYYGEAEDYLFTVIANCASKITSVTPGSTCGTGTVALSAVGTGATQYRWYDSEFGGSLLATTATSNWTTPSIATTTTYWVTSFNGTCESVARTAIKAVVKKTSTLSFTTSSPEVCGENSIISLTATGNTEEVHLINETFEAGGLGVFSTINNDANNATIDGNTRWRNRTSTHVPNTNVFFPAISSGFGTNRFALAFSDSLTPDRPTNNVVNYLALTNSVNTTGFLNLNLRLKFYYSRYFDNGVNPTQEQVTLEVSTDGGATYPTVLDTFTADTGIGSRFATLNYVLPPALLNQTNLKIRVRHHSNASATGWLPDGVAVDDIELYGDRPLSPNFTWSGASLPDAYTDAACTIPYVSGTPAPTVWIKPTLAQLEMGSYSFIANANLSNGCTTSTTITVTNKSKVWKGTVSNDWNNAANWLPAGVPDINTCVVVPPALNTNILNTGANGLGKNLSVKTGGDLDIQGGKSLTIKETVNVDAGGIFNIQNNGSLVQIDNVANTVAGTFSYKRNAITNSYLDYVYWSTPVAGFSVNNITPGAIHRYLWNPTTASGYTSNFGNWAAASGAMTTGRGYIVRGSSGTSSFNGVPNNGNITIPITRSTYLGAPYAGPTTTMITADDDNWNLLGNPYPSAINADDFLATNSSNLNQFIKIWTHGIDPSSAIVDPFYQDYQLNYSTADYITYNALGGTQFGYDGKIGAGQGFFTLMNDANSTAENVVFNNAMRSSTHRNDQFYKTAASIEKNRIWLKLIHPNNSSIDALVGYATGATNSIDATYDTKCVGIKTTFEIYSIAENKGLLIQGRALPFDVNDTIPLGVTIPQDGIYTIAINAVDGLFQNATQGIYLEDLALGTVHNLRIAPYTFTGVTGVNENRFVLKFNNQTLSNTNFDYSNEVSIFKNNNITINSTIHPIKDVTVYDILGKVLVDRKNIGKQEVSLNELKPTTNVLIVKVTLDNNNVVLKKVIY